MESDHTRARSDSELLDLSRGGDTSAFGELWNRHRLAGIVAARNIAPTLDADDLVSGAYLKIFELLKTGRGPTGAFRPYLYKVISSSAADTYRSPEISSEHLDEIPDLAEAGPWEEGAFDLNATARAFESLPERWQAVLWYSEVEGMAPRQIAPLMGISANTVSALAARAKEGLQSGWVETHINMQLGEASCRAAREQLQRFQRGKLTARRSREVQAHLDTCADCAAAAKELSMLNNQLALMLATIFLGGISATALLQQFGSTASLGSAVGASAFKAAAGDTTSKVTAGGGAGGGAATGSTIIAVAASITLVAAAAGGAVFINLSNSDSAGSPPAETSSTQSEPDPELSTPDLSDAVVQNTAHETAGQASETSSAITASNLPVNTGDAIVPQPGTTPPPNPELPPTSPLPPQPPTPPTQPPVSPPPTVPPFAPDEIIAGYQCFVPNLATNEFELFGQGSLPGTVEIGVNTTNGTFIVLATAGSDHSWTSGPFTGLDAFISGSTTAQLRLIAEDRSSLWENVTATQCPGSGPAVDPSLQVTEICYLEPPAEPGSIYLSGALSEYGVIFARHVSGGSVTSITDPQFDGIQDPFNPAIIWSGIFTGVNGPGNSWVTDISVHPFLGAATDYNAGNQGVLEFRIETSDNRSSTWMPIDQLNGC